MALLEAAPDLDVVPISIDGSWQLFRNNLFPVPFGTRIRIRFADPIRRSEGLSGAQILERVRTEIDQTLRHWRDDRPTRTSL